MDFHRAQATRKTLNWSMALSLFRLDWRVFTKYQLFWPFQTTKARGAPIDQILVQFPLNFQFHFDFLIIWKKKFRRSDCLSRCCPFFQILSQNGQLSNFNTFWSGQSFLMSLVILTNMWILICGDRFTASPNFAVYART